MFSVRIQVSFRGEVIGAKLSKANSDRFCGGTVIDIGPPAVIMTAAHCVDTDSFKMDSGGRMQWKVDVSGKMQWVQARLHLDIGHWKTPLDTLEVCYTL